MGCGMAGDGVKRQGGLPPRWLLVAGMFSIQLTNVGYTIVAKLALGGKTEGVNPLIFSFLRDGLAFPILLAMAWIVDGVRAPALADFPRFLMLGLTGMFGNQFLFILGLQITNVTIGELAGLCCYRAHVLV